METTKNIISLIATCIGLAAIVIGLKYAVDILQLIFSILISPTQLTDPIQQIAQIIGGSIADPKLKSGIDFLTRAIALMFYGCGALLGAWLTLALMHTGAKIVALNAGERSAIKKLLQRTFGNNLEPKATAEESNVNQNVRKNRTN